MRTEICCITIWGHDEQITQDVTVEYDIEWTSYFDGLIKRFTYTVERVEVLSPITIEPVALKEDIENGISFAEGVQVSVTGNIECTITSETVRV